MAKKEQMEPNVVISPEYQKEVDQFEKGGAQSPEKVISFLKENASKIGGKIEKVWGSVTRYFKGAAEKEVTEHQEEALEGVERVEKVAAEARDAGADVKLETMGFAGDLDSLDVETEKAKEDIESLIDELTESLEAKEQNERDWLNRMRQRAAEAKAEQEKPGAIIEQSFLKRERELKSELRRKEDFLKKAESEMDNASEEDKKLLKFKVKVLSKQIADIKRPLETFEEVGVVIDDHERGKEIQEAVRELIAMDEEKTEEVAEQLPEKQESVENILANEKLINESHKKYKEIEKYEKKHGVAPENESTELHLSFSYDEYKKAEKKNPKRATEMEQEIYDKIVGRTAKPTVHAEPEKPTTGKASIRGER
ncbi:MAG: hypothetical protein HQ536_03155 [Parcubacteria group bacterium]|nr:hypothetical protein [Parcubacteria group bacterium]